MPFFVIIRIFSSLINSTLEIESPSLSLIAAISLVSFTFVYSLRNVFSLIPVL